MSTNLVPRRAIAIVRVSTDEQDCERQRRDVAAAARAHNLEIVRTLELEGLSGTKMLSNAEVGRVLDDLGRPGIDGVIVSSIDRLVRPGELGHLAIFDSFQRARKKIWTPAQEVDVSTQAGFLMSGVSGIMSGIERLMILQRTAAGKETVRLRGGNPNGRKALSRGVAYSKVSGWSYTEPDASRMRRAYDLLFERKSYRTIADEIGGGWTDDGIAGALRNPVWKGVRFYTKGRETPLEVPMGIKPLIEPARWEAAQKIILDRRQHWMKTKKPPRFLLVGLLRCSCGKSMYIRCAGNGKRHYYYCASAMPKYGPRCPARNLQQEAADRAIEQIASRELLDAAYLQAILGKLQTGQPARRDDTQTLARERVKLESERQELLRLTLKKVCTEDDYARESRRIEVEIRSLDNLQPPPVSEVFDPAALVRNLTRWFSRFPKQPFMERRGMLQEAVREIVVADGQISSLTLHGAFVASVNLQARSRRNWWWRSKNRLLTATVSSIRSPMRRLWKP